MLLLKRLAVAALMSCFSEGAIAETAAAPAAKAAPAHAVNPVDLGSDRRHADSNHAAAPKPSPRA